MCEFFPRAPKTPTRVHFIWRKNVTTIYIRLLTVVRLSKQAPMDAPHLNVFLMFLTKAPSALLNWNDPIAKGKRFGLTKKLSWSNLFRSLSAHVLITTSLNECFHLHSSVFGWKSCSMDVTLFFSSRNYLCKTYKCNLKLQAVNSQDVVFLNWEIACHWPEQPEIIST